MDALKKPMTISLSLKPGVEAYLREKAIREGRRPIDGASEENHPCFRVHLA